MYENCDLVKFAQWIAPKMVVPGSGGVRKLRWAIAGKGKRGGIRVIYYFKKQADEIWMLTLYSKSQKENIPVHILKQIAQEIKNV